MMIKLNIKDVDEPKKEVKTKKKIDIPSRPNEKFKFIKYDPIE